MSSADTEPVWRIASFCHSGECVEFGPRDGMVLVRDSKHRERGALSVSTDVWRSFVRDVQAGKYDDTIV